MINYKFSFPNTNNHLISVEMKIKNVASGKFDLFLPAWRPGRYEIADFVENITKFHPVNPQGKSLTWTKTKFNVWSIENPIQQNIIIQYQYYANKMDAGNSLIDNSQIYINFINCTFFNDLITNKQHNIEIELPQEYKWSTALTHQTKTTWSAVDYNELVDSPILASRDLQVLHYNEGECDFEIVFNGKHPLDNEQIIEDFRKFTKSQIAAMGSFPTDRYLFLIQSLPYKHYHGVEHQNSTVLILGPNTEAHKLTYREMLLGVASHELFHTWNVTRIRPKEMSPYNFASQTYFDTGFVAEGFTTYFGDYYLKKSGVFSIEEYFAEINTLLKRHFENYGRFESSLIQSSINLWVDGYKNIQPSKKVSIYVKGALVSLILDLEIRKLTDNQKSLIDVVRQLMTSHTNIQGGYSKEDVYAIVEQLTNTEAANFLHTLVNSTEDLTSHLESALNYIGCQLITKQHSTSFTATVGALLLENKIIAIAPNSPADYILSIGDRITHLNKVNFKHDQIIDHKSFDLTIIRNGLIKNIGIESSTGSTYFNSFVIQKMDKPNQNQISNFNQWINI